MNSFCRIAAIGGLSCAIAGFAPASAAAEADQSYSPWSHWYVGTGVGKGFGAKFKLTDSRSVSTTPCRVRRQDFARRRESRLRGIALSPSLLVGLSLSFVAQGGKIAGNDTHMQITNFFATATWFPPRRAFSCAAAPGRRAS